MAWWQPDAALPAPVLVVVATAFALTHGVFDGAAMTADGDSRAGLLGIAVGVFVVIALASAGVCAARRPWAQIAVRVVGSWIAAIGLLYVAWTFKP